MQVFYGRASVPVNAAEVTSQLSVTEANSWGVPLRYLVAYNVNATLYGSGQADLSAQELAFRAALLVPGQDFVLKHDDGTNSAAAIISNKTATGTRVVGISTPEAMGGEFVTRRTISFTVTAEFHVTDAANALVSWQEVVSIQGSGAPRTVWRYPINAPAFRQIVSPSSPVRATQSGSAVGYLKRPQKPLPLWPNYLVAEGVADTIATPERFGKTFVNWPVQWSYTFERGNGPLVGVPLLPPGVI